MLSRFSSNILGLLLQLEREDLISRLYLNYLTVSPRVGHLLCSTCIGGTMKPNLAANLVVFLRSLGKISLHLSQKR